VRYFELILFQISQYWLNLDNLPGIILKKLTLLKYERTNMPENNDNIKNEINELIKKLTEAEKAYYIDSKPVMTDIEYDKLYDRLKKLEGEYPQFKDAGSPTTRVGSDIDNELPEKPHSIPVLSLDKCYSTEEIKDWINKSGAKISEKIEIVIEPKIDGASVVLYYEEGKLKSALTRGNGSIGNEITENIKTIRSVPLEIDYKEKLAVRGEVYIKKEDFKTFNEKYADGQYSNPRNLASGSIRRQKSKEAAKFPLNIFLYEGFFYDNKINNHLENLIFLKKLGFPLNDNLGYFSDNEGSSTNLPFKNSTGGRISDIQEYVGNFSRIRKTLAYEIDGLVIKINDLKSREELGFTQHHPRWAIAFKFDAPLAETKVVSIVVQIGRGGRATPVANLEPVELSGSVISRATLHNQDYINSIGVNAGDTVSISKRGDVIPAVEEVLEKGDNPSPYCIPDQCPSCGTKLIEDGAHLFCPNDNCTKRLLGTLQFFVSRGQMDIETLGDKTLEFLFEKGFVKYIPDIYTFDYNKLLGFEGFKEKKISNIIQSVETSKKKDFITVLYSLGLKDVGKKVSELIVNKYRDIDAILKTAEKRNTEELVSIDGIGDTLANSIINHFTSKPVIKLIDDLKKSGLNFKQETISTQSENQFLKGTKWVITGSFENFKPRDIAGGLIKKYGGELSESVSSKTTFLLCGIEAGSKLDKAKNLGIKIIDEKTFLKIIEMEKINE
jgi:DNA ligase (NAD+)